MATPLSACRVAVLALGWALVGGCGDEAQPAADVVGSADPAAVDHAVACLARWSTPELETAARQFEGVLTTGSAATSPNFTFTAVDADARTFGARFNWHDVPDHDLSGQIADDGALVVTLPVPSDRSLPGDVALVAWFSGDCAALVGRGPTGIETAVMVVPLRLSDASIRAVLAAHPRWETPDGEVWLSVRPTDDGVAIDIPSLGADGVVLAPRAGDLGGFGAYTMLRPVDGDPTFTVLRLDPDGRGLHLEIEQELHEGLRPEGLRTEVEACLDGVSLAGWLPLGGVPQPVTARLVADGLEVRDVLGLQTTLPTTEPSASEVGQGPIEDPALFRFELDGGVLELVVAHDCRTLWGSHVRVRRVGAWLRAVP